MAFVAQGVTEHHAFGAAAHAKMSEAGCSCHPRPSRVFKNKSYLPCNVIWNATRRDPHKSFYQPRSREEGRVGLTNDGYRCKTRPMASPTLQSSAFHHRGRQTRVSPGLYQHRNGRQTALMRRSAEVQDPPGAIDATAEFTSAAANKPRMPEIKHP
ncbi:hypothetical protein BGZ61DRAFT_223926 [Ilyonectria robusta]|uniref:uncharacterized protein n=1 Tax=Ilyonectria robusta TaxID=1079257 RepID=UPI001E8D7B85|nr:uncharacterized protein BGZ61DRAFT_223926 [Ilyonectria robusta]KAH8706582.1 hypothetical protein BGZ61DRAFT_223926 [Ilyonectria robusta]